jgi:hypothetical protein
LKESTISHDWRTVQIFVGEYGVAEVEVDSLNAKNVKCTCPVANGASKCAHVKYVKKNMLENAGHYTVSIPVDIDETEVFSAMKNAADFRKFIIKYGRVEVL